MQDHELAAYLGDFYDDTTPEQRDRIRDAAQAVAERYPDDDFYEQRTDALAAAVAVILGDDTLGRIGSEYQDARRVEQTAHARLTGALIAAAPDTPETRLAAIAGVSRPTVRKALGK